MRKESKVKKPLGVTVLIRGIIFIIIIVCAVGGLSLSIFNKRMMEQVRNHLTAIMNMTVARVDIDDLKQCIETKEETEKFKELTVFFDQARVYYDIDSLNLIYPHKEGDKIMMMQVLSGLTPEGRAGVEEIADVPIPLLGDDFTAFLPPEFLAESYNNYITNREISFSTSDLVYGKNYDAFYTIRDEAGEPVVLLTASKSLGYITSVMTKYIVITMGTIFLLSGAFVIMMVTWIQYRVIKPLQIMGDEAEEFQKRGEVEDPGILEMDDKVLHQGDEVEVLANILKNMSLSMKAFVARLMESAHIMEDMKLEVTRANNLAMRDALTGVKSKAAYDQQEERLNLDIKAGDAEFGIVMIDINCLKKINDSYGHEKGNVYIKKMCTMICDVFAHSPVFRVGGDEFVVVLVHRDYANREFLVADLKNRMQEQSDKTELDEWLRPTAAIGIALYDRKNDENCDAVFKRADAAMYENKKEMKACRED